MGGGTAAFGAPPQTPSLLQDLRGARESRGWPAAQGDPRTRQLPRKQAGAAGPGVTRSLVHVVLPDPYRLSCYSPDGHLEARGLDAALGAGAPLQGRGGGRCRLHTWKALETHDPPLQPRDTHSPRRPPCLSVVTLGPEDSRGGQPRVSTPAPCWDLPCPLPPRRPHP